MGRPVLEYATPNHPGRIISSPDMRVLVEFPDPVAEKETGAAFMAWLESDDPAAKKYVEWLGVD